MEQVSSKKYATRNTPSPAVRVAVAARHPLVAKHLCEILRREKGLEVTHLALSAALHVHGLLVIVFDRNNLELPLRSVVEQLKQNAPKCGLVMIDASLSQENLGSLACLPIEGFVAYSDLDGSLAKAIRSVAEGRAWLSTSIVEESAFRRDRTGRRLVAHSSLTSRELEVAGLLRQRLTNKEIAQALSLQETTVKFHVSNILNKLHVHCRHDLKEATAPNVRSRFMIEASRESAAPGNPGGIRSASEADCVDRVNWNS